MTRDHPGLGALSALVAAKKIYPDSCALIPAEVGPEAARFMERYGSRLSLTAFAAGDPLPEAGLVVVVDTRQRGRLGPFLPLLERATGIHIYDRHAAEPGDLRGAEISAEPVGAVTTLLVEEIRRRGAPFNEAEGLLFLLGIYRDTSALSNAATTPRDASAAAYLWDQGIDPLQVQEFMRAPLSDRQEGLLGVLFRKSRLYGIAGRRVLMTILPAGERFRGAVPLLRRLQELEEIDLAVTLSETAPGAISLTARTIADDLSPELLFAPFGAAGGRREVWAHLEGVALPALEERVLEVLERYLPPPFTALQIASTPVAAVDEARTVAEADEYFEDRGYSGGPVLQEGRVAGMISRRDLQRALRSGLGQAPVHGFMRPDAVTAGPRTPVTALRRTFVEREARRIVLVNADRRPLGLVTPADLLTLLYRLDRRLPAPHPAGSLLKTGELPVVEAVENIAPLMERVLPPRWRSLLLLIGQRASRTGADLYLVGGVIRDLLLGRGPGRDLDFVVIPDALDFATGAARLLGGELKLFRDFGTASIFTAEGLRLDFATARQEIYEAPAALPKVRGVSSLRRDLYRRDFTINTLACSLLPESYGELHDFFGGRKDLHDGVIRTLYQLSFVDDPLRMLRAVRFEQRFGFRIEENTRGLIASALEGRILEKVSRSRLAREISRIYEEEDPPAVLMRLHELGLLRWIYPRLSPGEQLWPRLNRVGEALAASRQREWRRRPEAELLYLSALLLEMAPPDRLAVIRRLGLSRRRAGVVLQGCEAVPPLLRELEGAGGELRPSFLVNRLDPLSPEALLLLEALAVTAEVKGQLRLYLESLQFVRPRLRGGSLKQLGLQPGPLYGEIIRALREAVLDGAVRSSEEELDFVTAFLQQRRED